MNDLRKGFVARAPTKEDFRAVADLILASDLAGFGEPDYLEEELLAEWKDLDLETDAWVMVTLGGELAGYAAVEHRRHALINAEGYVHPRYTGRGRRDLPDPAHRSPGMGARLFSTARNARLSRQHDQR